MRSTPPSQPTATMLSTRGGLIELVSSRAQGDIQRFEQGADVEIENEIHFVGSATRAARSHRRIHLLERPQVAKFFTVARRNLMLRQQTGSNRPIAEYITVIPARMTVLTRADISIASLFLEDREGIADWPPLRFEA